LIVLDTAKGPGRCKVSSGECWEETRNGVWKSACQVCVGFFNCMLFALCFVSSLEILDCLDLCRCLLNFFALVD